LAADYNGVRVNILRQQNFEILLGLSQRQLFKNMPQVSIGFQTIGFGGLDKTEEGGAGHRAIRAAREQPILPSDHIGTDGIFYQIVVRS